VTKVEREDADHDSGDDHGGDRNEPGDDHGSGGHGSDD
jgi:hypothetical protein